MTNTDDMKWFSLACQPQEPLSPGGATLSGDALHKWKSRFGPFLRYLSRRETVLALSGGGMAMPAHISTLRVLELLDVTPSAIYGTSAGAVIGGLLAAGMRTPEIEEAMLGIRSANDLFGFAARYPALRLAAFAIRRRFQKPTLEGLGIYDLDRIEAHVADILMEYVGDVPTMDQLRVPFHCVAVDIGTGESHGADELWVRKQIFSAERTPEVRLSDAIGASMSIPGVITPKRIGDRFYMDGAAAEHLPILSACDNWRRRRRRFTRGRLAIVASDLGYTGEPVPKGDLADPIDLVIFSRRLQERVVNHYNLLMCHRPRRGSSVILVRPRSVHVELYEIEKMKPCLHAAYLAAVTQLAGEGFLGETEAALRRAMSFLGLSARLP
jgi:predicted acylesterase/phospholipase RssA